MWSSGFSSEGVIMATVNMSGVREVEWRLVRYFLETRNLRRADAIHLLGILLNDVERSTEFLKVHCPFIRPLTEDEIKEAIA